jgi:DNA-binding response OmpR family regulator
MTIPANTSAPKRILVVDDCDMDLEIARIMLTAEGFQVTTLSDASQCLDVVNAYQPQLVLLDVMMPGFNGGDLLKKIREKFSPIQLPVIMVTSKDDPADVISALRNGANDYVTKPVQFDIALRRIQTQMALSEESYATARTKELEAINAMVITYNHEINNALTIGLGYIEMIEESLATDHRIEKIKSSLQRIGEVVKKVETAAQKNAPQYVPYAGDTKMFRIEE